MKQVKLTKPTNRFCELTKNILLLLSVLLLNLSLPVSLCFDTDSFNWGISAVKRLLWQQGYIERGLDRMTFHWEDVTDSSGVLWSGLCSSSYFILHEHILKRFPCSCFTSSAITGCRYGVFFEWQVGTRSEKRDRKCCLHTHSKHCSTLPRLVTFWDVREYLFNLFYSP